MIGNEAGQVHVLESGELKNTITIGTEIIGAIAGCSRGFIAGCGGTIHIYEMLEGKSFDDKISYYKQNHALEPKSFKDRYTGKVP